ncbi:helix-turn-helix transcriptional regulator [Haloarchaeobius baliensis]|uniref:helix-turn-helix transcriptional regulator n=1 Tax=Haloarchaeobius baliensis TaxID=1670458 RepID=UPI003F88215F
MDATAVDDTVALLSWGPILEACHDGPVDRSEIAERAGCSRSTAYRATTDLREEGLLERTDRGYRITGEGAAVLAQSQQFVAGVEGTARLQPLLEYVDNPAFVDLAARFADAEVVAPLESVPYRIENRMQSVIEGTRERMFGMTDGLGSPALAEAMFDRLRSGVTVDWLLPREMYDQFTAAYGPLSTHADDGGATTVFVHDELPVNLAVYDETLVVLGFDRERGVLGAVAIADDPVALQWSQETFEACRGAAERVE